MIPVVLGLGSNKSFNSLSPLELLGRACLKLGNVFKESGEKISLSSVYCTKAMYVTDQSDFYNMAVLGFLPETCSPQKLLEEIHKIEAELGRDRTKEIRFGPRSIDIDIELFGKLKICLPDLEIPHPRLCERSFILTPMLEILPESADCIDRDFYAVCLSRLSDQGIQKIMDCDEFRKRFFPEAAYECTGKQCY